MIDVLAAPGSLPFTVSLLVMMGLLLVELLALLGGFGVNELFDSLIDANVDLPDSSVDIDAEISSGIESTAPAEGGSMLGRVLAWLYVGRVPLLMVLILFLTIFGLAGLFAQTLIHHLVGTTLPAAIAAPVVFVLTLPLVRGGAAMLARLMPKDESSAVDPAGFVGRTAVITGGVARTGLPAQARLSDRFGTTHYVMVEPEDQGDALESGSTVLLIRRINGRFTAIANPNQDLVDPPAGPR